MFIYSAEHNGNIKEGNGKIGKNGGINGRPSFAYDVNHGEMCEVVGGWLGGGVIRPTGLSHDDIYYAIKLS